MRKLLPIIATLLLLPLSARADSVQYDNKSFPDLSVKGVGKSGLVVQLNGTLHAMDLSKVQLIQITSADKFNAAESARAANDSLKAAPLYLAAIRDFNDENLKQVARLRAIAPLQDTGKFTQALDTFLTVYAAIPNDAVWAARPTKLPAESSSMLPESAQHIEAALPSISSDDAKHNLKVLAMELYTRANDPRGQQLARELGTGVAPENPTTPTPSPTTQPTATLEEIQSAIKSKDFTTALAKSQLLLQSSTGDAAIQLFILRALAYQGQSNLPAAAAELLRIPIHYPASSTAPDALFQAATLEKQLHHPDQAQSLLQEILTKYPDSPAAAKAKSLTPDH